MEAPLHHQSPIPLPLPPQDAALLLQHAAVARALMAAEMPAAPAEAAMMGREQCPRCASRDTKFCYYNNYNTAQPRHFCRACRRYWTLGGSLRNVPVGGSTRKRPRPARPTRALAAAVAAAACTAPAAASGGPLFAPSPPAPAATAMQCTGGLLGSLFMGLAPASVPGGLLGLGQPAALGDSAAMQQQLGGLGFGGAAGPFLWPATTTILEGNRAEEAATWKSGGALHQLRLTPPAAALWQELAAAAPVEVEAAGGLHPHLLL
ncbi:hypothetical protein U9M48_037260 [Paspalum notatum var. saurae]|uniref:Dof zinc finger protein n=1 Tax=Paspalum notatum var. saurae TaxID=547442 RepID=A0AAQ3UIX2_PASNO